LFFGGEDGKGGGVDLGGVKGEKRREIGGKRGCESKFKVNGDQGFITGRLGKKKKKKRGKGGMGSEEGIKYNGGGKEFQSNI